MNIRGCLPMTTESTTKDAVLSLKKALKTFVNGSSVSQRVKDETREHLEEVENHLDELDDGSTDEDSTESEDNSEDSSEEEDE